MSGWVGDGLDTTCLYFPTAPGATTSNLLLVRVKGEPEAARRALDDAISSVAPGSVATIVPVEQAVAMQVYPFRAASWIASFLGALALGNLRSPVIPRQPEDERNRHPHGAGRHHLLGC